MRQIRIEKLTLNIGAGTNQDTLKKGMKLLKNLTGKDLVKTISQKRIPSWGVRPGLPVGCKTILRGEEAEKILIRLIAAKDNKLNESCFDSQGNVAFGIHEYIDVPDLNYDPSIGIMGFQVCVTLSRPGYRVKYRKKLNRKLGKGHIITKEESIAFFKQKFGISLNE
ncbi:50S ribosomal protein L5 [Candidatus Woesearchaeota archaeon]|nr:50S ribosomal protein L5 [Candidatus Woesearchaeota archaeon]